MCIAPKKLSLPAFSMTVLGALAAKVSRPRQLTTHQHQVPCRARWFIDRPKMTEHRIEAKSSATPKMLSLMWLRALRVHQWAKNILLFVPLFVGHVFSASAVSTTALGFALLCLLS